MTELILVLVVVAVVWANIAVRKADATRHKVDRLEAELWRLEGERAK